MKARRPGSVRLASLGGAILLTASVMAMLQVGATAASAAPVTENFASYAAAFTLFVPSSLTTNITQPALVAPDASYSMSVGSRTEAVPTSLSGLTIGYTTGIETVIPVPSGATYVSGSLSTGLTWTFVNNGVTTHGAYSVTYCSAAGPGCTATPHSSTFLGSTSTPYFEVTTGATHFAGGGTLTFPAWSASFKATGAVGSSIQPTVSEYDYTDDVESLGVLSAISYPSGVFSGTPTSPPPYVFQPLASTNIGVPTPAISAVLPNSGPVAGGNTVTIHGDNLTSPTKVMFGTKAATDIVSKTADAVTVVAPPGTAGSTVKVSLTNSAGTSSVASGAQYTYTTGPIVTGVSPRTGPPTGGTSVTITGLQLTGASKVDFGSTPASAFNVDSANSITATAPAGTGIVDVTVTNSQSTSVTSSQDRFSYNNGYWLAAADGGIFSYPPSQPFFGSAGGITLNKPVVGVAATPDTGGYWLAASDGGVFNYGDAGFFGSAGALTLAQPVVGIAPTPSGFGYWLVASDGGVFSYGDAGFFGSTGGQTLNAPIVGIASTPDGNGYWLVAADGGVFAYGDAGYYGSMGGTHLNQPIVGVAATPDGAGYWLVASDGGVFSFGDAAFYGSTGGQTLNKPVVGIASNPDGGGYWLTAADGGIFNYGSAAFDGSAGATPLNQPVVGIAAG